MKRTKNLLLEVTLVMLMLPVYAAAATTDVAGNYLCSGNDASRKAPYTDVPLVVTKNGEVLSFKWDFSNQKMGIILGLGIPNVKQQNVIAAIFWDSKATTNVGVITYELQPDGSFDGNWAIPGGTAWGTESCKKKG